MRKKHKIGLVLSGGAARGFAHIGVLQAMDEHGIKPGIIAGTSAGAIVGSLYADGYSPGEILDMFKDKPLSTFGRLKFPKGGLVKATGLAKILKSNYRSSLFEELNTPFVAAATCLNTGEPHYFSEGALFDSVMASACIPILFNPVEINGKQYVDGGVKDNLPISAIEQSCRHTIGVNVNPVGEVEKIGGLIDIALRTFHLSLDAKITHLREKFDLFIEPGGLVAFNLANVKNGEQMCQIGYREMDKLLTEKKGLVKKW